MAAVPEAAGRSAGEPLRIVQHGVERGSLLYSDTEEESLRFDAGRHGRDELSCILYEEDTPAEQVVPDH